MTAIDERAERYLAEVWSLWAYVLLAVCVLVLATLLQSLHADVLQRFLGDLPPLIAVLVTALIGAATLVVLSRHGGFAFYKTGHRGLRVAGMTAALFGAVVIPADLLIVYPADINVPWPVSLLFYPVAGFIVETTMHLLPLALVVVLLTSVLKGADRNRLIWIAVAVTALLEPAYQSWWMWSLHQYSFAAQAFNTLHVLAFNLAELALFRRYDFVTMYAFRLMYYAIWHIGWGIWRLEVLF